MSPYSYVVETDEFVRQRLKVLVPLVLFSLIVAGMLIFSPLLEEISIATLFSFTNLETYTPSALNLMFIGFIGGLFFFPLPQEAFYGVAVGNGGAWPPLFVAVLAGFLLANVVNYVIGWKLNSVLAPLVSPKKLYGIRRWVGKFGGYAVFVVNVLPLPAPLLTFALGIVRYNTTRLFVLLTAANIVKFAVITFMVA